MRIYINIKFLPRTFTVVASIFRSNNSYKLGQGLDSTLVPLFTNLFSILNVSRTIIFIKYRFLS